MDFPKELFPYMAEFVPDTDTTRVYNDLGISRYDPSIITGFREIGVDPALLLSQSRIRHQMQRELAQEYALVSLLYATGIKWTLVVDEYNEMWIEFGDDKLLVTPSERIPEGFADELATIPGFITSLEIGTNPHHNDILNVSYPHPLGDENDDPYIFDRVDEDEHHRIRLLEDKRLYQNLLLADRLYISRYYTPVQVDDVVMRSYSSHGRSCPVIPKE